jgi:hypothetical protein
MTSPGVDPRFQSTTERRAGQGSHRKALRANISETSLVPLINEQGEKANDMNRDRNAAPIRSSYNDLLFMHGGSSA